VPETLYSEPIGKGVVRKYGDDVTIIGTSYMVHEALEAAKLLEKEKVSAEVIDLRSLKPIDEELLLESVARTGRVIIADGGWKTCGAAAEVAALIAESGFGYLTAPVRRVTLPDTPAPASSVLEEDYYPKSGNILDAVRSLL
jgi:pyruvate dehydrogenase E1 component beta subunit